MIFGEVCLATNVHCNAFFQGSSLLQQVKIPALLLLDCSASEETQRIWASNSFAVSSTTFHGATVFPLASAEHCLSPLREPRLAHSQKFMNFFGAFRLHYGLKQFGSSMATLVSCPTWFLAGVLQFSSHSFETPSAPKYTGSTPPRQAPALRITSSP